MARALYERIEPVAESFPDLDPAIDLRVGDVEPRTSGPGSTRSSRPCSRGRPPTASTSWPTSCSPTSRTCRPRRRSWAPTPAPTPTAIDTRRSRSPTARSPCSDEVLASKITGEEEAYSRIDLLDFAANVEGSLQAFATLKPALNEIDPTVVPEIATKFDDLVALLETYRDEDALGGWMPYRPARRRQEGPDRRAAGRAGAAVRRSAAKIATAS